MRTRGKSRSTILLEQAILDIVEERAPITVRGVCYALFTRGLIAGMATKETQRVSRIMTDMRERTDLDWTLVVDGSRSIDRVNAWNDPAELVDATVSQYRRDYWQDQPTLVEVWSEKSTIQGVLAPVLNDLGVTFRVMKGFGSFTAVMQAAEDSTRVVGDPVVLYIGDWDPSGLYMSEIDLPARLDRYGSRWEFQRIAVLEEDTHDLPSFDAASKRGDVRYDWYTSRYGSRCWELDAIDPNDLRDRVREQIETRLDLTLWEHAKAIEAAEVESMRGFHKVWQQMLAEAKA